VDYSDYDAYKHDGTPTYRADLADPSEIFTKGFIAKGTNADLEAHIAGDTSQGESGYVATTKEYLNSRGQVEIASVGEWIYKVHPQEAIDVERYYLAVTGAKSGPYANELEVAIPRQIAPHDIEWAVLVGPGEIPEPATMIRNPAFKPRAP
jgi:Pertussis toxin, subunit 1